MSGPDHRSEPWKSFVSYEDLKSPPLGERARRQIGFLLRRLQQGHELQEPVSRKLRSNPSIFELRIPDGRRTWRLIYFAGPDEVVVLSLFRKTTAKTPRQQLEKSRNRLKRYLEAKEPSGNAP